MKRHALLLIFAAMSVHAAQAAVICAPGADGRIVATSPWGSKPPTEADRQRCASSVSQPQMGKTQSPDQIEALTNAADALAKAARLFSQQQSAPQPTAASAPAAIYLVSGKPLGEQLREQGKAQGWTVVWNVDRDWIVPSATTLAGDFEKASSEAIESAAAEGAPLAATVYRANHTIVVTQTGVTNK